VIAFIQKEKNMKTTRILFAGLLMASSMPIVSFAQDYRNDPRNDYHRAPPPPVTAPAPTSFQDSARVTRVLPRYERVNIPEEQCRMEIERVEGGYNGAPNQGRSIGGSIIGGIAGAVLGNQIGGGNGRTAATAAGAIGGAMIGDRVGSNVEANQNQAYQGPSERQVRRCTTFNRTEDRVAGYDVTYQYQGRSYTTVMPQNPGNNVRVNVSVTPVIY
jgi:uncharacterized protein YcfJ